MLRHQFLIGCAHTLSGLQSIFRKPVSRIHAAHGLHNNTHLRILQYYIIIMHQNILNRIIRKFPQIQNIFYSNFISHTAGDTFAVGLQYLNNTGTNRSVSEYSYFNHIIPP